MDGFIGKIKGSEDKYKMSENKYLRQSKLCGCGCLKEVNIGRNYINGHAHRQKRVDRNCLNCGKQFQCREGLKRKFCSNKCSNQFRLKGKPAINKGKTLEEFIGIERAKEVKERLAKAVKGKSLIERLGSLEKVEEYIRKQKESHKNPTNELRRKRRILAIKRMSDSGGQFANYNREACEFFKAFDEKNNTKGRYAVYGGGEFYVRELGYWLDYINFELKTIIECDELYHFDENGNLRESDIRRQKEIQELYPYFRFIRFKNNEISKVLELNFKTKEG